MKSIFDRMIHDEDRVLAECEIIANGEQVQCTLAAPNDRNLIILLMAYFTKIRWYMETEPQVQLQRMQRMYVKALENLPEVRHYCITSCARNGGTMVFTAQVTRRRNGSIGLLNQMPDALGDMDSPDSCFVLLKAVWERLNAQDRQDLADCLRRLRPVIMAEDMDRSGKGLEQAFVTGSALADLLTDGHWEYL